MDKPDIVLLSNPGPLPAVLASQLATFVQWWWTDRYLGDQVDVIHSIAS